MEKYRIKKEKLEQMGQMLKARRMQLNYTQEFAAEKAEISYSFYVKIENGIQAPSLEVAVRLANALHFSLDEWLLDETEHFIIDSEKYEELFNYLKTVKGKEVMSAIELLRKVVECFKNT